MANAHCLILVRLCICGLNFLNTHLTCCSKALPSPRLPSGAQQAALDHVVAYCSRVAERIDGPPTFVPDAAAALQAFDDGKEAPWQTLDPERVDRPEQAGMVDGLACLSADAAANIRSPDFMFPEGAPRRSQAVRCLGTSDVSYAAHTANLLKCGKVRLRLRAKSAASVFAIGKRGKSSQREVWSGGAVSEAAPRPPRPPRLGNPAMCARVIKQPGKDFVFAKRDAKAFFDQLALPPELSAYFGRPAITAGRLAEVVGCHVQELAPWIDDLGSSAVTAATSLVPINTVWPMGFSWSSFVAQSNMVAACLDAGIDERALLCLEEAPPYRTEEWVTVATDDVILIHQSPGASADCTQRLDEALRRRGFAQSREGR